MEGNRIVKLVFNSPQALKMLIINYLLLAIYFLTQVAVLAAPIPSDSGPYNAVSMQMDESDLAPTQSKIKRPRKTGSRTTKAAKRHKTGPYGVSLLLWRPLFSIVTRGMTLNRLLTLNFLTSHRLDRRITGRACPEQCSGAP